MKAFQYLILYHPTDAEKKKGDKSKILVEQKTVLAVDERTASFQAVRDIPEEYADKMDQVEIACRPF